MPALQLQSICFPAFLDIEGCEIQGCLAKYDPVLNSRDLKEHDLHTGTNKVTAVIQRHPSPISAIRWTYNGAVLSSSQYPALPRGLQQSTSRYPS